jgi:hypothetical protein
VEAGRVFDGVAEGEGVHLFSDLKIIQCLQMTTTSSPSSKCLWQFSCGHPLLKFMASH